ncbi:MAG: hypothetical protein AAF621_03595 [Pseudomonadota bacterium]
MRITKLRLTHFRNARHIILDDLARINYIQGENGAGKTNILDSITRCTSQAGLKNQSAKFCTNTTYPDKGWGVDIYFTHHDQDHHLTTGLLPRSTHRVIQYFGTRITQAEATHMLPCLWLTPVGEKIFTEDAADIRTYFHHMVGLFFSDFHETYSLYERACRQRLKILTSENINAHLKWLQALEEEIATQALNIMQMRDGFMAHFQKDHMAHAIVLSENLPHFSLYLECPAQNIRHIDQYKALLMSYREKDAASKRTLFGPHRVKWCVKNLDKNIDIAFCSTGEQKAVLMAILFVVNQALIRLIDTPPLILLDDAYAHFDQNRIAFLDQYIAHLPNNIFLTGTDFHATAENAKLLHIDEDIMQGQSTEKLMI